MEAVPYISGVNQDVVKEMAGSSHTLGILMSKLRSSLEAGKKQPRVWLQYVLSMANVLFYQSFGAPLVLHWSTFGVTGDTRYIHGGCTEILQRKHVTYTVSRRRNGNLTEVDALDNVGSSANETAFIVLCTYVRGLINLYLFLVIRLSMELPGILLIINEL